MQALRTANYLKYCDQRVSCTILCEFWKCIKCKKMSTGSRTIAVVHVINITLNQFKTTRNKGRNRTKDPRLKYNTKILTKDKLSGALSQCFF